MKTKEIRFGLLRVVAAVAAAIGIFATVFAADVTPQQDCRSIEDDAARLACYDNLASPSVPAAAPQPVQTPELVEVPPQVEAVVPQEVPPTAPPVVVPAEEKVPVLAAPAAAEAPAAEPVPLDDEVGKESLGHDEENEVVVHGTVVKCVEDATSKYLFYFDNGQIWKQKDNTIIRWKECAFDVTITKDFFGYKMIPVGETRKVRIGRVK